MKTILTAVVFALALTNPVMSDPTDYNKFTQAERTEFYKQLELTKRAINAPQKPITKARCKEYSRIAAKYKVDEPRCVQLFKDFIRNPF